LPRAKLFAAFATVAALVTSGCTASDGTEGTDLGFGHIHGVDVNPADGMVYAATHTGVFRLDPAGPVRVADRYQDTMGFTIIGPDLFLGSGHPSLDDPGPVHLGLIRSTDRALTWSTLSLAGQADFHALSAAGATVYGHDATTGTVLRSDDAGQNWQRGAELAIVDLDVDPSNPQHVLATSEQGLLESADGGITFSAFTLQPPRPLALVDHVPARHDVDHSPRVVGVDRAGTAWALSGGVWERAGSMPEMPTAFTVVADDWYLAGTASGVISSDDGGRTWSTIASTAT
jgi:DNA-binding beta-propeller fold protein YncE